MMKRSIVIHFLCIWVPMLLAGCIESREPREVSQDDENRNHEDMSEQLPSLLAPLRLGMPASEAESVLSNLSATYSPVTPTELLGGVYGTLPNGVECTYGLKDNLIVYISTTDERVRVGGIGVGSTLQEVMRAFPAAQLEYFQGYARIVKVTKIAWVSFRYDENEPTATSRITSVDFWAPAREP